MSLAPIVSRVRTGLLSTEDTVCLERARLVTEAFRRFDSEPMVLKRAHAFAHVLREMTLDVQSNPVFAGNTSSRPRAWMLVPEHGFGEPPQVVHENASLKGIMEGAIPGEIMEYWRDRAVGGNSDPGHLAVNLQAVVHQGLGRILARLRVLADTGSESQQVMRAAMALCLRAVIDWSHRYADAAGRAAAEESDAEVAACHRRVAEACWHVPEHPARNVFEALQAMVLIHLALHIEGHGMSVSVGLPDRVLEPFVEDMRDREETVALFGAFMLKLTANSVFGRGSKTQAITVGGADHTGQDRCNAWTRCFIEAADLVRVGDPHVFLRWHPVCDPGIKELAARLLADGLSMPLLINDETTVRGFINAGVDPVDAWGYCVIGCNELGIPGISAESANSRAGNVQYLALLNEVLFDHPDPDALSSIEEVLRLMERRLRERNRDARQRYVKAMERIAERAPVPFTSALMDGCVDAGADMTQAMKYRLPGLYERGLTNAANALAAIDQLAFRNRELPLSALVADLRRDFQASDLQARLRAVPKWGNDDDRVDRWTERLLAMRERVLDDIDREFGHGGHLVCHVVRSLHHFDGFRIGASPDGRNAGTPVADSLGAQTGTAHHGPTAILNSVAKIDAARYYRGGTNLNITLSKRDTRSDAVLSLIEGFFRRGGQELQINCLDAETLREAQCDPETYGDLVVRFAGLSSRFVDLSPVEQDELIARAE